MLRMLYIIKLESLDLQEGSPKSVELPNELTILAACVPAFAKGVNDGCNEFESRDEVAGGEAKSDGHLGMEDVLSHRGAGF
jgi:hypothetical protein